MCKTKHEATDKTKVIFIHPPKRFVWRAWLKGREGREYAAGVDVRTWRKWKEQGLRTVEVGGLTLTKPEWIDSFLMAGKKDLKEEVKDFLAKK